MAFERGSRPLVQCLRSTRHDRILLPSMRTLATTTEPPASRSEPPPPASKDSAQDPNSEDINLKGLNPYLVHTPRSERKLFETKNQLPIGTRRRRAAIATSANIPFSQLPYQCFQEARNIIREDRHEKLDEIAKVRDRIGRLQERVEVTSDEAQKRRGRHRLDSLRQRLDDLKIYADINDPLVKKRFEDGQGMPIHPDANGRAEH